MACPICAGEQVPPDVSTMERLGKRVVVQGKIYAIIPGGYTYSPFKHHFTASLYPRRGKVKYLKFRTQQELERWSLAQNQRYVAHGCMHVVDGKELVFDITHVEIASE